MKTPNWLKKFRVKLANNQVDIASSQPIVMSISKMSEGADEKFYKDEVIVKELYGMNCDDNRVFHVIDPIKHISKSRPGGCIEQSLLNKFYRMNIEINNETLQIIFDESTYQASVAPYHVVILNAIPDFVQNYYLKPKGDINTSSRNYQFVDNINAFKKVGKYPLQCIVFLNDDGSYFCALPCMLTYSMLEQESGIIVEEATIEQVSSILDTMPLVKVPSYNEHFYQFVVTHDSYSEIDEKGYLSYFNTAGPITSGRMDVRDYVNVPKVYSPADLYGCQMQLGQCYYDCVFSYLTRILKVTCDKKGDFHINFVGENSAWKKELAKYKNVNAITRFEPKENSTHVIWEIELANLIKDQALLSMNFSTSQEHPKTEPMESITIDSAHPFTPLKSSHGLNDILLTMAPGKDHQYYLYDNTLVSLYGKGSVSAMEFGDITNN